MRPGRERDADRKAPRLSLLRAAAARELGGPHAIAIELDYPTLGEGVEAWTRRMVGVFGEAALASIMTKTGRELIEP